jgi:flagellar motor switch protein FliM
MVLKIGNRRKFLCKPGQIGNKLAVQIIEKLEEIEEEDFEELTAEEGE